MKTYNKEMKKILEDIEKMRQHLIDSLEELGMKDLAQCAREYDVEEILARTMSKKLPNNLSVVVRGWQRHNHRLIGYKEAFENQFREPKYRKYTGFVPDYNAGEGEEE